MEHGVLVQQVERTSMQVQLTTHEGVSLAAAVSLRLAALQTPQSVSTWRQSGKCRRCAALESKRN